MASALFDSLIAFPPKISKNAELMTMKFLPDVKPNVEARNKKS